MSIIRSTLADFASMLGMSEANAGESLKSERAAKAVLTRRSLFAAAGTMATGALITKAPPVSARRENG